MYIEDGAEGNEEVEYIWSRWFGRGASFGECFGECFGKSETEKTNSVENNFIFLWTKINTNQKSCS